MLGVQMVLGCMEVVDEYLMRHHKALITLVKLREKLGMQIFNLRSGVAARDMHCLHLLSREKCCSAATGAFG